MTPTARQVIFGDTYIAASEFCHPIIKAKVLMVYRNSSQPDSIGVRDQLSLYTQEEMRPVWRIRREIENLLEF